MKLTRQIIGSNPKYGPTLRQLLNGFSKRTRTKLAGITKYAYYAYKCEQWEQFIELLPKLGQTLNYDYFGGKNKFDQMVQLAKGNIKDPPPAGKK